MGDLLGDDALHGRDDRLGRSTSTRCSRTPALTAHAGGATYELPDADGARAGSATVTIPAVAGLPVDQHLGNLEGQGAALRHLRRRHLRRAHGRRDRRLGQLRARQPQSARRPRRRSSACGSTASSAARASGMINLLIFLIIGVFLAGLMVGRTPEYLGKKVEAREMKLAMLALLIHPIMILGPTGLFAATTGGMKAANNPGAARLLADPVRVLLGVGEQRLGLRRARATPTASTTNPTPAPTAVPLGHRQRPGDAHQPLHPDHRADRHGRQPGGEEVRAVRSRHAARRHRPRSAACCSGRSCSSAPCCSCRSPRSARSPSISGRSRSAAEQGSITMRPVQRMPVPLQSRSRLDIATAMPRPARRIRRARACSRPSSSVRRSKQSFVMLRPTSSGRTR